MSNIVYLRQKTTGPIELYRSSDGTLMAEMEGKEYERVRLVRAFPHSFPDRFISVRSQLGEEIMLLRDLALLDDSSRYTANEELRRHYMVPNIQRITSIRKLATEWSWQVVTDCGRVTITMDDLHGNIHAINASRWILTDTEGRRYMLSNVEQMDAESRRWWEKVN
ncbi:DUF1854 domain-containing protein [Paenibacillus montanisoli]|uniref:DUF1854 domain-containing protein n=1 Tax=Paenibacillus montanisoli TaxID=2081970 RepID=A0A328TXU3_9BACL|nr:DUF1854 domain-containing protein [Paenibacillus montanisoli]RAP75298.1 hypothetical protein DL346_18165 [Paenibacillus montanisoli]